MRTQGDAGRCAPGVPASPAGTCVNLGQSHWSVRYSVFGALIAGSDASERSFFGYDGEAQSPVTGLIYLRARHYDAASGRFGVADAYLGSAADPITQNRYLFCASDPVNHIDPSGRLFERFSTALNSMNLTITRYANHPNWYKPTGGTPIAGNSFANLPGQLTVRSGLISIHSSTSDKKAQANANTSIWLGQQAMKDGDLEAAKKYLADAAGYIAAYQHLYCGSKEYLDEVHSVAGDISSVFFWVPLVGSYADVLYYGTEGNAPMYVISNIFFLIDAFSLGAASAAKVAGKVALGAGMKAIGREAAEEVISSFAHKSPSVLEKNMIAAGQVIPNYPYNAHHIVAKGAPQAQGARDILAKWGIDVDSATSGVFLRITDVGEGAYHPSLHTKEYYQRIEDRLIQANSREEAEAVLRQIADELATETF